MKKEGADTSKLELRYYSRNYRGVHAVRDIKKGEQILYVPGSLILNYEDTISKHPIC